MKKLSLLFCFPLTVISSGFFAISCNSEDKPGPQPTPIPGTDYTLLVNGDENVSGTFDRFTTETWIYVKLNLTEGYKITQIELFDGHSKIDSEHYTFEPENDIVRVLGKDYVKSKNLVINLKSDKIQTVTIDVNRSTKAEIWSKEQWIITPNKITAINCYDTYIVKVDTSKWGDESFGTLHKVVFVQNDQIEGAKKTFFYGGSVSAKLGTTTLEKGTQEQVYAGTKDFCFNNSTAETSDQVYFKESLINKGDQLEITLKFKEFDSTTYPCFFEREDKGA